ncbi:hypothetical protein WCT97_12610, partial [Pectobacterium versatile]|uniref:hypothetical protein n=1 Tax=Pectobacterium versatile TaxID=2488639 RepID=UPI003019DCB0
LLIDLLFRHSEYKSITLRHAQVNVHLCPRVSARCRSSKTDGVTRRKHARCLSLRQFSSSICFCEAARKPLTPFNRQRNKRVYFILD